MNTLSKLLFVFLFLSLLSACSGGGGGSSVTNSSDAEPVSIVTQSIEVQRPSSLDQNEPLEIIGSNLKLNTDLTDLVTSELTRENYNERLLVLDSDGNVELIGYVSEDDDSIELSPESTAISVIAIYPSISPTYNSDPAAFYQSISGFEEVAELATLIDTTPNWSDFDNSDLIAAYAAAVIKVLEAIESNSLIMTTSAFTRTQAPLQIYRASSNSEINYSITKVVDGVFQ
tara:strand:+ start:2938 stop:3627 length:690 start_codon:yes stop_codon:yes gene_type:complete